MIKLQKHTTLIFGYKLQTFCTLVMLLFYSYNSFSQQISEENQMEVETFVISISEQLQAPITDSTQLYTNMFKAVRLSKEIKDKKNLVKSYHNLAQWHEANTTLDSTIQYLEYAKNVSIGSKLHILEAETYLKKENAYKQRGNYGKAMDEGFKALKIYEKLDNQHGIAKSYTRLCDLLYYQEKYKEGADYCQKAIDILVPLNAPDELAISYRYKADNLLILERYDDALNEINKAILVLKKANKDEINIAPNYNTRGNIYKYLKRYDDALAEYKKCYQLARESNNKRGLIPALGNLGHVNRLQGNYEKAITYNLESIEIMKSMGDTRNLFESYMNVSDSYAALGQFEKALEYERLFSGERFKNMEQNIEQLESELQIKYESAKKDETIVEQDATINRQSKIQLLYIGIAFLLGIILFGMYFTMRNIRKKRKALSVLNNELASNQEALENSNNKLTHSLEDLKATQAQLIQSEKMASLGELTAGIAHEIQNPLNFVNNFSEISNELIDEMNEEIDKGDLEEAKHISKDIKQNLEKITHHGKRADAIVKGMLQHSRKSTAEKEPTDINKLADEYLRLAYHGLRAKDKSFNATLETDFDTSIGKINVIPQEMGRVILNLITNAFYATNQKKKLCQAEPVEARQDFKPTVSVTTKQLSNQIEISVKDNGNGIPKDVIDKIYQPFFTTKPTGEGTGLGLSMSYDIIKAHGGNLEVDTKEGKYTLFKIIIPTTKN